MNKGVFEFNPSFRYEASLENESGAKIVRNAAIAVACRPPGKLWRKQPKSAASPNRRRATRQHS